MELAVLALLSGADSGSDVGLELVEAEGDDLFGRESVLFALTCARSGFHKGGMTYSLVGRDVGGDGALGAAVAGEGGADDLDVLRVRSIRPAIGADDLANGAGGGERGKEEGNSAHFDLGDREIWTRSFEGFGRLGRLERLKAGRLEGC